MEFSIYKSKAVFLKIGSFDNKLAYIQRVDEFNESFKKNSFNDKVFFQREEYL